MSGKGSNHIPSGKLPNKGRVAPKRKDFSEEARKRREWRQDNLNSDPYAVKSDTPEGRDRIERGNRLVENWTAWALDYARSFTQGNPSIPEEDLEGAALLGMVQASRIFEPNEGYSFSTLATWYMRMEIQRLVSKSGKLVCRPRNWRVSIERLMSELDMMAHEGLTPEFDGACERMGLKDGQRGALRDMYKIKSIEIIPESHAVIPDDHMEPVAAMVDREEFHQLREAMKKLPGIYVSVLIDLFNRRPMAELEVKYGVSAPTLLRYKRRGLAWLKYHMGQGDRPSFNLNVMDKFRDHVHPQSGTMVPVSRGKK